MKRIRGDVFDYLDAIRARPGMYLRDEPSSLTQLETLMHGYYAGLATHGIVEDVPGMTHHFSTWLYCETNWSTSRGWAEALTTHARRGRALDEFYAYVEQYRKLVPVALLRATLGRRNTPTGTRVVIGMNGRMERPSRVEIVRYKPTRLHFLRFWYERRAENGSILMSGTGSHSTSVAFAKRWVADELQTRDADWRSVRSNRA